MQVGTLVCSDARVEDIELSIEGMYEYKVCTQFSHRGLRKASRGRSAIRQLVHVPVRLSLVSSAACLLLVFSRATPRFVLSYYHCHPQILSSSDASLIVR